MNYAITGHKGLIGDFLKKRLDLGGHKCVMQVDQREGFNVLELLARGEHVKPGDIDIMYHFAAQCKINESIKIPELSHRNNVDGISQVLEFCRKKEIPRMVVASTSRVLSPEENPYTASKKYVEALTKAYHDCYGLNYIIVRPSTVYGPAFDATSRLINNFFAAAFKEEPLKIFGDKNKTLDFTYVDDFVEGVMTAVDFAVKSEKSHGELWNTSYNISGDEECKIIDVANEVIMQTQSKSPIKFFPPEKAQPQQVSIDVSPLRALGWSPKVNIHEGIKRMTEFYKENPWAWQEYKDNGAQYYANK
jgi:nucleoside-diphosphate-sugar epimerase